MSIFLKLKIRFTFTPMTRTELRDKMLVAGELERPSQFSPYWVEAFEMYKKETGDYQVSIKCGSCFNKVKAWLKK